MSKSILREPETVRPWQQSPLRPACPKSGSSVLADLTSGAEPASPEALDSRGEAVPPGHRETAEQLLQQAREEADLLRAAAVREGFADGQARALEAHAEERQRLRELLGGIGDAYHGFCLNQAPALAALAAAAAEKLLHEQLSLEPQRALVVVQQALEQVAGSAPMTVHLNPADMDLIRGHLMNDPRRSTAVQLAPDPTVEPGGCWIESGHGEVDATISGRLARLKELWSDD